MENKAINEIRKFVRAGLVSLNTENMEDAQGNIVWTARAQKDRNKAKSMLNPEEIKTLEIGRASCRERV